MFNGGYLAESGQEPQAFFEMLYLCIVNKS